MCKGSNALSRPVLMVRGLDGFDLPPSKVGCAVFKARRGPGLATFGGDSERATPLPIPNREVKPLSADGTWASRPWESRSPPFFSTRAARNGRPAGLLHSGGLLVALELVAPIAVSTVASIFLILTAVMVLFFIGGLIAVSVRSDRDADAYERARARRRSGARAARAPSDRGWDRELMEGVARSALSESRPDFSYGDLHLVLVEDTPGMEEDRAHFVAVGSDGERADRARPPGRRLGRRERRLDAA